MLCKIGHLMCKYYHLRDILHNIIKCELVAKLNITIKFSFPECPSNNYYKIILCHLVPFDRLPSSCFIKVKSIVFGTNIII